jgi:hypothetical protein
MAQRKVLIAALVGLGVVNGLVVARLLRNARCGASSGACSANIGACRANGGACSRATGRSCRMPKSVS